MRISKISSKATYHKCLRDLNRKKYIQYEPSYNPYKGSLIFLFDFSDNLKPVQKRLSSSDKILSKFEPVVNKQGTSNEPTTGTSTEQALVSSINNTNITNNSNIENLENLGEQAKNFEEVNNSDLKNQNLEKEKSSAKKEKEMPEQLLFENQKSFSPAFADYNAKQTENSRQKSSAKKEKVPAISEFDENQFETSRPKEFIVTSSTLQNPSNEQVKSYFLEQNFPEREANKFFNYFSSVGWLVGGKTPMVDWKAAAKNWMLNAPSFISHEKTPDRAKHLNTGTDKDYSEPF